MSFQDTRSLYYQLLRRHCQSKFVYFAKMSEPDFAAIDFLAFLPGRSEWFDGRSKYLEFCSDNALQRAQPL